MHMKFTLTTTLAAVAMIAGSACAFASDDLIVSGSRTSPPPSLDQKATNACFNAFIAELLPGTTARVRVVIPADGVNIFKYDGDSVLDPYKIMVVEMNRQGDPRQRAIGPFGLHGQPTRRGAAPLHTCHCRGKAGGTDAQRHQAGDDEPLTAFPQPERIFPCHTTAN
jgi:hypothetical protein